MFNTNCAVRILSALLRSRKSLVAVDDKATKKKDIIKNSYVKNMQISTPF